MLFGKPYRTDGKLIFPGFGWWLVVIAPWIVGVVTILNSL